MRNRARERADCVSITLSQLASVDVIGVLEQAKLFHNPLAHARGSSLSPVQCPAAQCPLFCFQHLTHFCELVVGQVGVALLLPTPFVIPGAGDGCNGFAEHSLRALFPGGVAG